MKKQLLLLIACVLGFMPISGKAQGTWRKSLLNYIAKLHKADGGYGWEDQYDSHTTVCFAVTGVLNDIGALPADKAQLAEFIRSHHPQHGPNHEAGPSGSDLRDLTYEQIQAILWLGGNVSSFAKTVGEWKSQAGLLANYEGHKYAGLYQDALVPVTQQLVNVPVTNKSEFISYFNNHLRDNGSYNNAPTAAGGDGNILNTYWALQALKVLGAPITKKEATIAWLQNCQLSNGGFTHQPHPEIGANASAIYTWAGIKALEMLGAKPKNVQGAKQYIASLRSADGGFGSRPGWHSTPTATWHAVDALKSINGFDALDKNEPKPIVEPKPNFNGYKIYTVQFQAQGNGSPQEAVDLAKKLNIQLWGSKYPVKGWVATAQKIADEQKVPVTFFIADEPHDNEVSVPGMGSFNHVLDYIAPAKDPIHFSDTATYNQLKNTTLKQLQNVNGGLVLQVSNNEPLARMLIDESINSKLGYLALSTVHFGQNFAFWLPYLMDYRYQLPLVTLQDAHGKESWWWGEELTNHRTLFIAKQPTYDAMITALKNNWVVGVRHDSVSNYKTRMFGGTQAARNFITNNQAMWKWWQANDSTSRPLAIITVVGKDDNLEMAKPASGFNIRVRCRWNTIRQTLKTPAVTLQQLLVDGKPVEAKEVVDKGNRYGITDAYYLYTWGQPAKGKHTITATVKQLSSNKTERINKTFIVK